MATLTYPGVYVDEVSSGVHTITGVPTSVAAFVGYTARGLENVATRIFSWAEFERKFGGLAADSELSYAVHAFFLNGGGQAYIVRVRKSDAASAEIVITDDAGTDALTLTAISSGAWGNSLVADIDYDGIPGTSTGLFNLSVTDLSSGTSERFEGLGLDNTQGNFADTVINNADNGSLLVRAVGNIAAGRPLRSGTISDPIVFATVRTDWGTTPPPYTLSLQSNLPAGLTVDTPIYATATDPAPDSLVDMARTIQRGVNAALTVRGAAIRCEVTPANELKFTAAFDQAQLPGTRDAMITIGPGSGTPIPTLTFTVLPTVSRYCLGTTNLAGSVSAVVAGEDGATLPDTLALVGDELTATGIYALGNTAFNILSIPDATRSAPGQPTTADTNVDYNVIYSEALTFCTMKRAFLLVDSPPDVMTVDKAQDWFTLKLDFHGPNAAAYFPRLKIADPLNDYKLRTVAPSGTIAGLYARTDASRGVWKAPAGTEASLSGVAAPAVALSDPENGVLNVVGLNCLRTFPIYSHVCWGARTLAGSDAEGSEWKYVPIRRTALFIEESLYRGTKWAVFEPNDEPLWAQIRLNIGSFMHSLFVQHAFQGSSPRDAYFVKCDKETTTQDDINKGIVNVYVGFAPLKPAEFIVLKIQQMAGQIQT